VNQFNPSLGTLESVTLTLTETIGGTSTITNNNSTVLPVPYKWDVGDTITLTDAALSQFSLTVDSPTFSATVNSHLTSSSQTITGSGGLSPISDSVSPYYGTGQLDLLVSAAAFQGTVTSGANGSVNIAGTSDATLEVTYDYLPTPLPAGLLLFAPGLAGLVIGKKRLSK